MKRFTLALLLALVLVLCVKCTRTPRPGTITLKNTDVVFCGELRVVYTPWVTVSKYYCDGAVFTPEEVVAHSGGSANPT